MPGVMQYDESTVLSIDDDPVPAVIRHERSVGLGIVFAEPRIFLQLSSWQLFAGLRAGFILTDDYSGTQRIIDPPGVTFDDDPVVTDNAEQYPGLTSVSAWFTFGASTAGARIGDVRIEPGFSAGLPITAMSSTDPFRVWSVSATLRIVLDPVQATPDTVQRRIDTVIVTDTVVTESATETTTRETLVVVRIDSTDDAITIRRELRRVIGIGVPTMLTEVRASFLDADGSEHDRLAMTVRIDRHQLRVADPRWSSGTLSALPATAVPKPIADRVSAALTAVQQLPRTTPITWTAEQWPSCTIRIRMAAEGDVEPEQWSLHLRMSDGRILDSIGGKGAPPDMIDRTIAEDVVRSLRNGGTVDYVYRVMADGHWTPSATASVVFNAVQQKEGTAYKWQVVLPKTPEQQRSDGRTEWTDAEQQQLRTMNGPWPKILLQSQIHR